MTNDFHRQSAFSPDTVRVFIMDHNGDRRREARITANVPIHQILPALVNALGLLSTDPSGRVVGYHLSFDNRQLQDDETLASAGVTNGNQLILFPELLAGARGGA